MANIFVISDTHFGHANMLTFRQNDGTLLRPGFRDVTEMDEVMIARWNATVRPQDHVYHLGDVAVKGRLEEIVPRLNGHKRLVLGNHDDREAQVYLKVGFKKLFGSRIIDGLLFTHIPVGPWSLGRKFRANVHGHVHANLPLISRRVDPDSELTRIYVNVCVEMIDYTPVPIETIKLWIAATEVQYE